MTILQLCYRHYIDMFYCKNTLTGNFHKSVLQQEFLFIYQRRLLILRRQPCGEISRFHYFIFVLKLCKWWFKSDSVLSFCAQWQLNSDSIHLYEVSDSTRLLDSIFVERFNSTQLKLRESNLNRFIRYPVWTPRTKRQCMKCHLIMCSGFWVWGELILYWGLGQWHFVIAVLSWDRFVQVLWLLYDL